MNPIRKALSLGKWAYLDRLGWHTDRKLLLFESDDWGSIRTPSQAALDSLTACGDSAADNAFIRRDGLERREDLERLIDVLDRFRDQNGRPPCFTANFAVANPDFDRIRPAEGIYEYEPFFRTYERCYGTGRAAMELLRQAERAGLIKPQLHTREHMNVARWMRRLGENVPDAVLAFQHRMIDVGASYTSAQRYGYMDALNADTDAELLALEENLTDAARIFRQAFGCSSKTFVASCFIWHPRTERILAQLGVRSIQTGFCQLTCSGEGTTRIRKRPHYTGQRSPSGLVYMVRTCEYEPAYGRSIDRSVEMCLSQIERAFAARKPAIVDTHRFNYIGLLDPEGAEQRREGLRVLLARLLELHPDVEFVSAEELSDLLCEGTGEETGLSQK